ncbi:MAG: AcrR family transcriptional regulator [Halioglobus sp.]|jgi:AcrR family transcriptional regulator
MIEPMPEVPSGKMKSTVKRKRSSRGEETRASINRATLQIIKRDGMRGVRHRAVAKEAGVPLGATTYHFKNIEELIVSAFNYWRAQPAAGPNPYVRQILGFLESRAPYMLKVSENRIALAQEIYKFTVDYEIDQIENYRDSCIVQLAFYHESIHIKELQQQVFDYWQSEVDKLIVAFTALASPDPEADARICQSLFHQLEREAMMKGGDYDRDKLKATLHRYVCHVIGVEFTVEKL